jgi:hypothetical protein
MPTGLCVSFHVNPGSWGREKRAEGPPHLIYLPRSSPTRVNTEDAKRVEERRELLDVCLELLAEGTPEAKLKAGDVLLRFFDNDAKQRIFYERHETRQRLAQLEKELRATGEGLCKLADWIAQQRQAV